MKNQHISREDVLRDFSVEFDSSKNTLRKYLIEFPEYANELVDLSLELSREVDDSVPLTLDDQKSIESALDRFRIGLAQQSEIVDIPPQRFSNAAKLLDLPKQVLIAFGGRRVELASVPLHFLNRLATVLQVTTAQLKAFLTLPPQIQPQRSYKSNVKPTAPSKVSFEKVLHDALIPEERIQKIMNKGE